MNRLYLLRHAKSSWDDPAVADIDRPLNGRGRAAAQQMALHLAATGVRPALVLCSPARRTRETLDLVQAAMDLPQVRFDERLYESPRDRLIAVLRELGPETESVMLIGHNPGLERLAAHLVGEGEEQLLDRLADKYPTGTLATLTSLPGATPLSARSFALTDFTRPRDLPLA